MMTQFIIPSNISHNESTSPNVFCPIHWSQLLNWGWRCSNVDKRCFNYIWVINNLIASKDATYMRGLTKAIEYGSNCGLFNDEPLSEPVLEYCWLYPLELILIGHHFSYKKWFWKCHPWLWPIFLDLNVLKYDISPRRCDPLLNSFKWQKGNFFHQ